MPPSYAVGQGIQDMKVRSRNPSSTETTPCECGINFVTLRARQASLYICARFRGTEGMRSTLLQYTSGTRSQLDCFKKEKHEQTQTCLCPSSRASASKATVSKSWRSALAFGQSEMRPTILSREDPEQVRGSRHTTAMRAHLHEDA